MPATTTSRFSFYFSHFPFRKLPTATNKKLAGARSPTPFKRKWAEFMCHIQKKEQIFFRKEKKTSEDDKCWLKAYLIILKALQGSIISRD